MSKTPFLIHVPRTAGQAMKFALDLPVKGHPTAQEIRAQLGKRKWQELFTFAFVRNPWDWLWSQYVAYRPNGVRQAHKYPWYEWALKDIGKEPPQCSRICDKRDNVIVQFVGRFEKLHYDWATLLRCLELPQMELPIINRFPHRPYVEVYDRRLRNEVAKRYARDIEMFGYTFGEDRHATA